MELEKAKAAGSEMQAEYSTSVTAKTASGFVGEQIHPNRNPGYLIVKRLFDIVVSGMALVILSPVFLLTALAIKIEEPQGKVFYKQKRIGQGGKPFWCHNLRCMELVRRLHEILGYIKAYFCIILTINFCDVHFRHQNGVFPAVETG